MSDNPQMNSEMAARLKAAVRNVIELKDYDGGDSLDRDVTEIVRLVLVTLRDPTPDMFVPGIGCKLDVWQAMIDACLS